METKHTDVDNLRICNDCVSENYLVDYIITNGKLRKCSFCESKERTILLFELIGKIENVILNHFEITRNEPNRWEEIFMNDKESDYYWEREGYTFQEILDDNWINNSEASNLISEILRDKYYDMESAQIYEETHFCSDIHYELKESNGEVLLNEWNSFKNILKYESRFFNEKVEKILKSIFDNIEITTTYTGESVITEVGQDNKIKSLFRARVFQSKDELLDALCKPDKSMGSPPSHLASSGRLNSQGISVFYGSIDKSTTIAEVRPPIGSKVVVAEFNIIRSLKLLDLKKLEIIENNTSVFDPLYKEKTEKITFLSQLCRLITQPVMPHDEASDYLPTQVVAEYLASRSNFNFDGIIFPSVQADNGLNITLFHKSSFVEPIILKENTVLEASDTIYEEDGFYLNYEVKGSFPKNADDKIVKFEFLPSLSVNLDSIEVHHIKSVMYFKDEYSVDRKIVENNDLDNIFDE